MPPKHRGLKVHLTLDDLEVLEHAELPSVGKNGKELKALHAVRDLFVVACWTGVRYSDLKRFPELLEAEWMANKGECPSELAFIQDKTDDLGQAAVVLGEDAIDDDTCSNRTQKTR